MFFWKEKQNFYLIPAGVTCPKSATEVLEQGMKYVLSQELIDFPVLKDHDDNVTQ